MYHLSIQSHLFPGLIPPCSLSMIDNSFIFFLHFGINAILKYAQPCLQEVCIMYMSSRNVSQPIDAQERRTDWQSVSYYSLKFICRQVFAKSSSNLFVLVQHFLHFDSSIFLGVPTDSFWIFMYATYVKPICKLIRPAKHFCVLDSSLQ